MCAAGPPALVTGEPLYWHPRFAAHTTAHGQVVLLEDGDAVLFEPGPSTRVAQAVTEHASAPQILDLERSVAGQAALVVALDEMAALDLVLPAGQYRAAADGYRRPRFDVEPRVLASSRGDVVLLTELSASDPIVGWASALAAAHRVAVAIADDELDPRLEAIDRDRRAAGAPWLLFKPCGRRPSIGPWFTADGSCWRCLHSRMSSNQPVRRWLLHQAALSAIAVPIAVERPGPGRLPPTGDRALFERLQSGALLQLARQTGEILGAHHVARCAHCPACGRRAPAAAGSARPLALRSVARRSDPDGGYRSHDAEDTLVRLSRHVSRVTGCVADVSIMPGRDLASLFVHRSAWLTCPLSMPTVRPADLHRVALGKGTSPAQSRASALCEALERSVAQYHGDEPCVIATAEELAGVSVLRPPSLRPLSSAQRAARSAPAWRPDEPLHWVDVDSLTRREIGKAPLTSCYANTPFAREEQLCPFDSNGCAAGRTVEEAVLQGLLEVIERDAVAIWWYNRLAVPGLPSSLVGADLRAALRRGLEPEWDWWLLDVTHDLVTPACVAVARRRGDGQFRFGFGCHLEAGLAARRAAIELCQLIAIGERRGEVFDFASVTGEPYLYPTVAAGAAPVLASSTEYDDIRDAIDACVARLAARGLEALVHRYAAIDDALSVVKAIVPGACHIWPQLGAPRLYQVPVDLGRAPRRLAEHELNPLALFV